jgi:EAL and modified HD-GYP domain-containing signal transduction protein
VSVSPSAVEDPPASAQVVVARQPITDRQREVVGFELLYRPRLPGAAALDGEQMTAQVVLGALTIGIDQLVGDKAMFCNAERGVLTGETPVTLPPHRTVIEILETVHVDDEAVQGCRDLVAAGFRLALDDFTWIPGAERLLELASIVKIDFQAVSREDMPALVERCRAYDVMLLAEKVETEDDIAWGMDLGFELFQGYAIERPDIVRGQSVAASALAHVQLAMTLLTDDVEFDDLEEILRREPGLVVQVLQMASVGSHLGMRRQVRTVREALVLLGSTRIRQWVALTILSGQPGRSPDGLATALVRARMTELLARARGIETPEFAFTAGLLSALDLLLSADLDELGDTMDLDDDVKDAAFRRTGPIGALVAEVVRDQECLESGTEPVDPRGDEDAAAAAAFTWAMPYVSTLETDV